MIIACAFPSLSWHRANKTAMIWKSKGYAPLVVMNQEHIKKGIPALVVKTEAYEGYYRTLNWACQALVQHEKADVVVAISDRMRPPGSSQEIGHQFAEHFTDGCGVMVPLKGAEQGDLAPCGPWIGRRFIEKYYQGRGPYWPTYFQYFGNRELFEVAQKDSRLWPRPDLVQIQDDWSETPETHRQPDEKDADYYRSRNRKEYWQRDELIWKERSESGYPGSTPGALIQNTAGLRLWKPGDL